MTKLPILTVAEPEFLPTYAMPGDAGADLRSTESGVIPPGERRMFKTGVSIALPSGYVALVHPRSGLAAKGRKLPPASRNLRIGSLMPPPPIGTRRAAQPTDRAELASEL